MHCLYCLYSLHCLNCLYCLQCLNSMHCLLHFLHYLYSLHCLHSLYCWHCLHCLHCLYHQKFLWRCFYHHLNHLKFWLALEKKGQIMNSASGTVVFMFNTTTGILCMCSEWSGHPQGTFYAKIGDYALVKKKTMRILGRPSSSPHIRNLFLGTKSGVFWAKDTILAIFEENFLGKSP